MRIDLAELHSNFAIQRDAVSWSRKVLSNPDRYVILDTETTGLEKNDEVIELAIIDPAGKELYNQRFCPDVKINSEAMEIHGITPPMLIGCPKFKEASPALRDILRRKMIISYNAAFDMRLIAQTYKKRGGYLINNSWNCAMLEYAKFIGEWDNQYNHYKWHKLESANHSALGDCHAVLALINKMACAPLLKHWYEFWVRNKQGD